MKKKILIADDDREICDVLQILLEPEFDITIVHRGDDAWERIQREKPELAILDLVMPKIDGLELCSLIRGSEESRNIKILIITATTSDKELPDRVWQMACGADAFISKPFDPIKVVNKVRELDNSVKSV